MPIHEKKRMPKSSHYILKYEDWKFGQGNTSSAPYINPPFSFPAPKEKCKYISAFAWTGPTSARTYSRICANKQKKFILNKMFFLSILIFFCVRADGTYVREDALTRPRGQAT
jgi:hypothetical protein